MEKIKKLRGVYGISQKELAEKIGISRNTLIKMESETNNEVNHNIKDIKKICDFFSIKPYELYGIDILKYKPKNKEEFFEIIMLLQEEYEKWVL